MWRDRQRERLATADQALRAVRPGGDSWAPVERFRHLVPAEEPTGMVTTAPRTEEDHANGLPTAPASSCETPPDLCELQRGCYTCSTRRGTALQKKLTITLDEKVYEGLHTVVGRRRISRFIEDLVRPKVSRQHLEEAYKQMARDEEREADALEWAEGTVGDVADETR